MNRNRNLLTTTCIAAMLAMPLAVQAGDDKAAMTADDQIEASDADTAEPVQAGESGTGTRSELREAWDSFARFTAEQKDAAVRAGDDLLTAMDERINTWRESARDDGVSPDEEQNRVAEMRAVRDNIAGQLEEAEVSRGNDWSARAWSDFKESMSTAVDEFQALFDDTAYEVDQAPYEDATATGGD